MNRLSHIQQHLKQWEVDLIVIDNPIDLYYLTHQDLSVGRLIVTQSSVTLYVDGRYFEACKQRVDFPVVLLSKENPSPRFLGKRLGFDADYTTYATYQSLKRLEADLVPLSQPLHQMRQVKDVAEVAYLKQAAELGSLGYDYILSLLCEGITEEEVAMQVELFWRKKGGERLAFSPLIAFGENAAFPHHHSGKRALKKGDIVLIDIGVVVNRYHSDMTRMAFFGAPHPKLVEIYHIVREAQKKALDQVKEGTSLAYLDQVARGHIEKLGYGPQFSHSLGHGVGLEIHEAPTIRESAEGELLEGMVITIEPGIYLSGVGGVRLEDSVVVTKQGYENLTNRPLLSSLPRL